MVDKISTIGPEIRNSVDSGAREWKVKWGDIIHYAEKMNSPYISSGTMKVWHANQMCQSPLSQNLKRSPTITIYLSWTFKDSGSSQLEKDILELVLQRLKLEI